jgi:hypothetical protein
MHHLITLPTAILTLIDGSGPADQRRLRRVTALGLLLFAAMFVQHQLLLLNYREWGDESETIIAARMIASGAELFSEIFNHHGPLTFAPPLVLELFGAQSIQAHRLLIVLMQWAGLAAIIGGLQTVPTTLRMAAAVLAATALTALLPIRHGHTLIYQNMAGLLLVVALSLYVLPIMLSDAPISRRRVVVGSALLASLPFLAVTYAPTAGLLWLAALRRTTLTLSVAAATAAVIVQLLFLAAIGSFEGFVAYHLYLNSQILPAYSGVGAADLGLTALRTVLAEPIAAIALVLLAVATAANTPRNAIGVLRAMTVSAAVALLLMRGFTVHSLPFQYSLTAFLPLLLVAVPRLPRSPVSVAVAAAICLLPASALFPANAQRLHDRPLPTDSTFARLARELTDPGDRVLSYSFNNSEYLLAERLPASAHFFYLPWQADYNRAPILGIKSDACHDIAQVQPKLITVNRWLVWRRFPWEDYGGCIELALAEWYVPAQQSARIYIRRDVAAAHGLIPADDAVPIDAWKIRPLLGFAADWGPREAADQRDWRWMGERATLIVLNPDRVPRNAELCLNLQAFEQPRDVAVELAGYGRFTLPVAAQAEDICLQLRLPVGELSIILQAPTAPAADGRQLSIALTRAELVYLTP